MSNIELIIRGARHAPSCVIRLAEYKESALSTDYREEAATLTQVLLMVLPGETLDALATRLHPYAEHPEEA